MFHLFQSFNFNFFFFFSIMPFRLLCSIQQFFNPFNLICFQFCLSACYVQSNNVRQGEYRNV